LFDIVVTNKTSESSVILISLVYMYLLLPCSSTFEGIFSLFYSTKNEKNLNVPYSELRHQFTTEYRRTNPVTTVEALKDFNEFMKGIYLF